ncbi:hypothetical protein [uncultured Chryseobacterium sp.]|uniref:hypothetical protein n=1 Tax=uncultured Chryseobacterium sp. TaxID=259322 RepID=UPI0037480F48
MLNKEELKKLFENGDIPRQEDFWEWQASYFHKEDHIPLEQIAYDFTKKADLVDGKVPASQLPSYVDDVLEFGSYAELPQPGEKGKIYITTGDNKQYRWSGSSYVGIDNTQLSNYIPYEGADRTVSLNSQNLYDIKHLYSHSGIQDGTMGLSVINDAAGGFKSNLLIKVSALAGNMLTFTVKLYSYPYEFYEFQINLYRYHENHYAPTVNWKSGESTHIGKIEFYKDPASGDFYVLILGSQLGLFAYPRVAVTDLQAYLGDQTFNKDHWKLEWDADASNLVLQATTLSEDFKKDSRAVSTHTDQIISGSKTFKRDLNITDDGLGINFEAGNKIYKKAGSGITLKKGSSNQNPRVESNDGTKSWEIIHEGNLQNIVSGNNGWGGNFNNITDPNITHKSGFFGADPNGNLPESYYTAWINVNSWAEHDNYGFQLASPLFGDNMYFRKYRSTGYDQKNHTDWYKLWTTNNFNPNDYWGKRDMGIYRAVTTNKPLGILDENNQAQRLLAGGLLLSDGYIDESLVPHLGIYSKGDINTPGKVISDKFSSSKLNGSQIINASNSDQLYIGNPVVDTVYHESGNNHIFTSKGNAGFTVDSNGNIKARNAVNAGNDSEIGGRIFGKRTMIDTLGLDESKYYPVTIQCNSSYPSTIKVYRTLDSSMGVPSYSTHGGGFWCYYEFEVYGNGWGTTSFKAICNYQDESWVKNDAKVIGYDQMIYSSNVVIYIKGGSKYWFDVNSTSVPTLHTSPYTVYGQTAEPTESRIWSGGILMNANTNDIRNAVNDLGSTLKDYVTLTTSQTVDGKKTFNGADSNGYTGAAIMLNGNGSANTIFPTIAFHQPTQYAGTISYRGNDAGFFFKDINGDGSAKITANGFLKAGSGDDYLLLGGGGHRNTQDFLFGSNPTGTIEAYPPDLGQASGTFTPKKSGFYRPNGDNDYGSLLMWVNHPQVGNGEYGAGLAFSYTGEDVYLTGKDSNGVKTFNKRIWHANNLPISYVDYLAYLTNVGAATIAMLDNYVPKKAKIEIDLPNGSNYDNPYFGLKASNLDGTFGGISIPSSNNMVITVGNNYTWGVINLQPYGGQVKVNGYDVLSTSNGIVVDKNGGINNGSAERSNKVWFDYNWAGTGGAGSVINFSGLNGNYSTELFSEYNGDHVGIRTHNGDNNTWSLHKWLWHSNNFNPDSKANVNQLFKNLIHTNNLSTLVDSGIYRQEGPSSGFFYTTTLNLNSGDGRQQLTIARNGDGMKFRGSTYGDGNQGWSDWRTVWTDHNFNPDTKANAENNAVTIGFDNGKIEMPYIKHNSGTSYLFSTKPVTYHGASYNANDIHRSGFYSIGHGMKETGNYSGSQDGARALIHFETEDVYSASQIQTERYTGNMVSRTKTDGGWSNWVRHWGSNDFTAGDIANWNNAISQSSASEEIILEDGQLTVQPDEFSLKGNSSYDIASRRKLVHVLFREGNELNIGKISRRQTFIIFNFEKSSVNISIEGLKPYLLAPATKITLYIDDEGEVLMYDESNFKKLG